MVYLLLVPVGFALTLRLIPRDVMRECREKARESLGERGPRNLVAAGIVIVIWLLLLVLSALAVVRVLRR